jgi:hypothetical protein
MISALEAYLASEQRISKERISKTMWSRKLPVKETFNRAKQNGFDVLRTGRKARS